MIKHLFGAIVISTLGLAAILYMGAQQRYNSAHENFSTAKKLLGSGKATEALPILLATEKWAWCFTDLATQYGVELIRCYVRTGEFDDAKKTANWMHRNTDELEMTGVQPQGGTFGLAAFTHALPNSLFNKTHPAQEVGDSWKGFDTVRSELSAGRDIDQLKALGRDVRDDYPNSPLLDAIAHDINPRKHYNRKSKYADTPPPDTTRSSSEPDPPRAARRESSDQWWGLTKKDDVAVFNRSGKKIRILPAGIVIEVVSLDTYKAYKRALVNVWVGDNKTTEPVVIKNSDLELINGPFGEVSSAEKTARKEIYALEKRISKLSKEPKGPVRTVAKNTTPPKNNLERSKRALDEINAKGKQLRKEFDSATGSRRASISDQLWKLKGPQAVAQKNYAEAKARSGGRHSPAPRSEKPQESELSQLQKRLHALKNEVERL